MLSEAKYLGTRRRPCVEVDEILRLRTQDGETKLRPHKLFITIKAKPPHSASARAATDIDVDDGEDEPLLAEEHE